MYGADYRGWIMRCGPAFYAQITSNGGNFYTEFNSKPLKVQNNLETAQAMVEEKIISEMRAMLPGYKVIFERVQKRGKIAAQPNVTPLHGKRE